MVILFERCATIKMTSRVPQPPRPHVVLRNGDTVFAGSVEIQKRFLNSRIAIDTQKLLEKRDILYAHTSRGHRYYVINNHFIEQVVNGRINVYSGDWVSLQNHLWKPDSAGKYFVRFRGFQHLQKGTPPVFLKPTIKTISRLVQDYDPSMRQIKAAKQLRTWSIISIPAGLTLTAVGFAAFVGIISDHKNPDIGKLEIACISGLATGVLTLSVALPGLRHLETRRRVKAIAVYNDGN